MPYNNKKFILFPNLNDEFRRNLEIIVLPHPKANKLCEFLYDAKNNEIYEIYENTERSNGIQVSGFLDDNCISKLEFCISTKIDPIFLMISALAYARDNNLRNINLMEIISYYIKNLKFEDNKNSFGSFEVIKMGIEQFYNRLILSKSIIEKIDKICNISNEDIKLREDNNEKKYTLNDEKLFSYLCERINNCVNISLERKITFKEYKNSLNKNYKDDILYSVEMAQKITCDLLLAFISNNLTNVKEKIIRKYGELGIKDEMDNLDNKNNKNQNIAIRKNIKKNNNGLIISKGSKKTEKRVKLTKSIDSNNEIFRFLKKKRDI